MIKQHLSSTLRSPFDSPAGFTVVEFVIVIVLIAVLGAVTMSRFVGGNTFNEVIVRDQIISMTRTAQQSSLGRDSVSLTIQPNAGDTELVITSSYTGGTIQSVTAPMNSVSISGDINVTDSCGVTPGGDTVDNASPITINFEELGDLGVSGVTGSTGAITSALRICLNDDAESSVCVSPSGFAYAGDCDA